MRIYYFIPIIFLLIIFSCKNEEEKSERFKLLTNHAWISDSLLADGLEAGGEGEILRGFSGKAVFNEDGTGNVGIYSGNWFLNNEETTLSIDSDSLATIATAVITELTEKSLKISTLFPSKTEPIHIYDVKMTFIPFE